MHVQMCILHAQSGLWRALQHKGCLTDASRLVPAGGRGCWRPPTHHPHSSCHRSQPGRRRPLVRTSHTGAAKLQAASSHGWGQAALRPHCWPAAYMTAAHVAPWVEEDRLHVRLLTRNRRPMHMLRPVLVGRRLYEYVVRHFLGALSPDAVSRRTSATFTAGGESFSASGIVPVRPGFTAIMPWRVRTGFRACLMAWCRTCLRPRGSCRRHRLPYKLRAEVMGMERMCGACASDDTGLLTELCSLCRRCRVSRCLPCRKGSLCPSRQQSCTRQAL